MDTQAESPRASTPVRELLAGLVGIGVALVCVLPPLLHLLTGPLGPFIGGFVVSHYLKPGARGRAIIAGTIGAGMAGIAAAVAFAFAHFSGEKGLPSWFPSPDLLGVIIAGIGTYAAGLAAAGTVVSGRIAKREEQA